MAVAAAATAALFAEQGACAGIPRPPSAEHAERRQSSTIDRSTLNGKLFVGYQGWFRKPGEGDGNSHWTT